MPNANLTLIAVILDRSGSMQPLREATIAGLNEFLDIQRKDPNETLLHMVQFDNHYDIVRDFVPLRDVKTLTQADFEPRGGTALFDAMGRTITEVGARLAAMPEATRPGKVVVVIQTDGEENASREYRIEHVREMITHQREKYGWEFVFLGANVDAFASAQSFGILRSQTLQYNANVVSTRALYATASNALNSYKSGQTTCDSFFSAKDQQDVLKTEDDTGSAPDVVSVVTGSSSTP